MGEITLAFALFKPEIFTLSADQLNMVFHSWIKALQVLSPNTIVHIQDWYWQTSWQADFEKDSGFLSRSSEQYHHERPWMNHHCYLHITRRPRRRMTTAGKALLQTSLTPEDTLTSGAVEEFATEVNQFIRILKDSGLLQCHRLTTDDLVSTEQRVGHIERYCQLIMPEDKTVESRDIHFEGGMRIGNNHCCIHSIADAEHLPAQCSPMVDYGPYSSEQVHFPMAFAARLGLLLPCNHIYNQYLFIEEPTGARKKLETRRQRMQSLSAHSRVNALNRDAIDAILNESISDGKQLIKAHFNILSWTKDRNAAGPMSDMVAAAIARLGATPYLETVNMAELWYAGIPGNAADLPAYETFDILADHALCLLPQETNYQDSISAYGVRLGDRLSGRPLQVDLSDEPLQAGVIGNRNKTVFGGSGSGKSVTMNLLLQSYHEQGAHVLVVDIGNSYQGLCELSEGNYFTYTASPPLKLNPFWIPFGEMPDIEKLESLKALILGLRKMEGDTIIRSEMVTLSNALQLYYAKVVEDAFLFPCFNTFYEFLRDEFTKVLVEDKVKNKEFDMDNFLYVLHPFYKGGEYDFLLNAREQLDLLQQRFIVFELDVIKDHAILFPVVTLVIMEVFIGKMRKLQGVRKVILIEESWKAIARQGMSEYLKYLFKTVRKFYGEAIVVTQEVDDIISSPIIKQAILNNTDCNGSVKWAVALLLFLSALMPSQGVQAQFPIADIIQTGIKKVIVATDLAIQRLRTATIAVQNTQKAVENAMRLQRLTDIADWVQHQKVRDITEQQVQLTVACKKAWAAIRQDPHFSAGELDHIGAVYSTILDRSIQQTGQLTTVITAWLTQMEDGGRLEAIDQLEEQMDRNRRDLLVFTEENILLSLQRSKDQQDIRFIQTLYNIH